MIHIDFNPKNLTVDQQDWWANWETRARAATTRVLKAWEASRMDPNDQTYDNIFNQQATREVWGELKDWLLKNYFNDKCAYCETPMVRATMHAEHYWPKGRVTQNRKKVKIVDDAGNESDHPGYFWLAFHWTNLLPACEWCNTVNGKRSEFPIPNTTYLSVLKKLTKEECDSLQEKLIQSSGFPDIFYFQPVDLALKEGRLLLHPYLDDPRKSLMFDDFGKVIAKGNAEERLRGEWSIEVFNLNDPRIKAERVKAQEEGKTIFDAIADYYRIDDDTLSRNDAKRKAKTHRKIVRYLNGAAPYSAAVLHFLEREYESIFA